MEEVTSVKVVFFVTEGFPSCAYSIWISIPRVSEVPGSKVVAEVPVMIFLAYMVLIASVYQRPVPTSVKGVELAG